MNLLKKIHSRIKEWLISKKIIVVTETDSGYVLVRLCITEMNMAKDLKREIYIGTSRKIYKQVKVSIKSRLPFARPCFEKEGHRLLDTVSTKKLLTLYRQSFLNENPIVYVHTELNDKIKYFVKFEMVNQDFYEITDDNVLDYSHICKAI